MGATVGELMVHLGLRTAEASLLCTRRADGNVPGGEGVSEDRGSHVSGAMLSALDESRNLGFGSGVAGASGFLDDLRQRVVTTRSFAQGAAGGVSGSSVAGCTHRGLGGPSAHCINKLVSLQHGAPARVQLPQPRVINTPELPNSHRRVSETQERTHLPENVFAMAAGHSSVPGSPLFGGTILFELADVLSCTSCAVAVSVPGVAETRPPERPSDLLELPDAPNFLSRCSK